MAQRKLQPQTNYRTVTALLVLTVWLVGASAAVYVWLSGNLDSTQCGQYCGSLLPGDSARPAEQILLVTLVVTMVPLATVWWLSHLRPKPSNKPPKNGIIRQ